MTTKEKRMLAGLVISTFVVAFLAGFLLGKNMTTEWLTTDLPQRVEDVAIALHNLFNR